ncbi:MAG: hypothetical protein AAFN07_01860 [Pseudomonadota bacterium]
MYLSEHLAFVELHKTGGSHIGRWLAKTVPGEQVGKHNRLPEAHQGKFVIGSVRNPWDWYVSLWAYGCSSRGSVWRQTIDAPNLNYYRSSLHNEMGQPPGLVRIIRQWLNDRKKPRDAWLNTYTNVDDPKGFRQWLGMIMDAKRALDVREGYGFSTLPGTSGLMTYRYLKLFTNIGCRLYERPGHDVLRPEQTFEQFGFIDDFVRMENLEPDLVAAIRKSGFTLTREQESAILASSKKKTNTSERRPVGFYYDAETLALVARREAFVIERHGYEPPELVRLA